MSFLIAFQIESTAGVLVYDERLASSRVSDCLQFVSIQQIFCDEKLMFGLMKNSLITPNICSNLITNSEKSADVCEE